MTVSLDAYRVSPGEKPVSSAKQNGMIDALEDAFNALPPSQLVSYPNDATKFLNGAGDFSAPQTRGISVGYVKTHPTEVTGTGMKDLFGGAFIIPANSLSDTGGVKIWAGGQYMNNSGSGRQFGLHLSFNNNTLWFMGTTAPGALITSSPNIHAWYFEAVIQAVSPPPQSYLYGSGRFVLSGPSATFNSLLDPKGGTSRMYYAPFMSINPQGVTSIPQPIKFFVGHSATSSVVSMNCVWARVEVMY